MDIIRNYVKALWHHISMLLMQLPRILRKFNPQFSPDAIIFSDTDPQITVVEQLPRPPPPPVIVQQNNLEWNKLIINFCFASAIEIANQSDNSQSQNSPFFRALPLAISLAFASLFVAKFIGAKFAGTARALEQASIFFAATAFFLAVSIPFPLYIKCTTWAVYAVSLLAIFICRLY